VAILELSRSLGHSGDGETFLGRVSTERGPKPALIRLLVEGEELAAAERIDHPNLVAMLDRGIASERGGAHFIAFEAVRGRTLRSLVVENRRRGAWPPYGFSIHVIREIARVLIAVHQRGAVLKNLGPATILLSGDGRVLLFPPPFNGASLPYLSPEQVRGETLDHRSDLFTLGVIMAELLTGAHPFAGHTEFDTLTSIIKGIHPPWPDELRPLGAILDELLAVERDQRIGSATALSARMGAVCPDFSLPESRRRCRRLLAHTVATGRFDG
jgi:serine/threonine protein kinase